MKLWYWILDLLFPPKCALCRRILEKNETDFCANCRKDSPLFPELPGNMHPSGKSRLQFLDSFTAVWYYKGNVRSGILRLKFHGAAALAAPYGRMLAMKLYQCRRESFDLITWVPVSTKRRRKRGYDQAELLARRVKPLAAHVNLIPLNHVDERSFEPSKPENLKRFVNILTKNGVNTTIRRRLGSDVDASCGQLRRKMTREAK